jgi:hypothetical protein
MSGITGSPALSARFGLLVVILIVVAIAAAARAAPGTPAQSRRPNADPC